LALCGQLEKQETSMHAQRLGAVLKEAVGRKCCDLGCEIKEGSPRTLVSRPEL